MPSHRASYSELKDWFLSLYFDMCRTRGFHREWTFEKMLLHVHDDFVESYTSPIEVLMADVIGLTLTGGWFPELDGYFRKRIEAVLHAHDLDTLLAPLPPGESEEFSRDLKALKIVAPAKASAAPT